MVWHLLTHAHPLHRLTLPPHERVHPPLALCVATVVYTHLLLCVSVGAWARGDNCWVCDIKEGAGEANCDFLFTADLCPDGVVTAVKGSTDTGRCIFKGRMYDIQAFTPGGRGVVGR